jgi:hypothetical protein
MSSAAIGSSPSMTVFSLSTQAGGGLGTVGLTNTVFEVEGISEVGAKYPSMSKLLTSNSLQLQLCLQQLFFPILDLYEHRASFNL